jgi:hypothetical protein
MRDDFSNKTKDILAKRVAWRCSFPGCLRITIGPGHQNQIDVVNLGEAAHINAASKDGPRYDEKMTKEQRKSIENGIWMCRHHARMIDSDYINYSAATIKQWKILAEEEIYRLLKQLERDKMRNPTTLVSIGGDIVFEGIWKAVNNGSWIFEIFRFIIGQESDLREFNNSNLPKHQKYIVVETQGDGRLIKGDINWQFIDNNYEITINVEDKTSRTTPYHLTDISSSFEFENGDLKMVKGEDCAKQIIMISLSTNFGELFYAADFGSYFSSYYWRFKNDLELLLRLIKLEVTRLITIPYFDSSNKSDHPPLNFINRVIDIEFLNTELIKNQITIKLKLEWGDGKYWEDNIDIYIKPKM